MLALTDDPKRIIAPNIYADVPIFVIADTKGAYVYEYSEDFSKRGYSVAVIDPTSKNITVMKDNVTRSMPFSEFNLDQNGKTAIFLSEAEEEQSRRLLDELLDRIHDAAVFIDNITVNDIHERIRKSKDSRTTVIYTLKDTAGNEEIAKVCHLIWSDYSLKDKGVIYGTDKKTKKKIFDKAECMFANGETIYVDGYAA